MSTNEELVLAIQAGENVTENMAQLYNQNRGMIYKLTEKYRSIEDPEDLRQEAYFGLIRAVELWSPDREANFATYCFYWIRQTVIRYIHDCGRAIRIPSNQRQKIYEYQRAASSIRAQFGRDPMPFEIMALLKITKEQYEKLLKDVAAFRIQSTSTPIGGEDDDILLEDALPDPSDPIGDVIEKIQHEELKAELWGQVDKLPEREADVLRSRYQDNKTLKQCGDAMGMTAEAVRCIEASAMRRLRRPKVTRRLSPYLTESRAYSVGLTSSYGLFKHSGSSAQERAVMLLEQRTGPIWRDSTIIPSYGGTNDNRF